MNRKLLQEALDHLVLHSIFMRNASFERHRAMPSSFVNGLSNLVLQFKHQPSESGTSKVQDSDGAEFQLLVICYECDARVIDQARSEDDPLYQVFSSNFVFSVEYLVKDGLPSEQAVWEFSYCNVAATVWPYWREALSSALVKASLPTITLPICQIGDIEVPPWEPVVEGDPAEPHDEQ